ncbi:MAG TPA: hypothetical protein VF238_06690 [Methylomirabilota bacterium]
MATTPPKPAGLEAQAPMFVDAALNLLKKAMRVLDPVGPEGQALHKAMTLLAKHFGSPSPDLTRASMKLAGEGTQGVTPANPAAFQQMMQQKGAAAGGGAPPQPPAPGGM